MVLDFNGALQSLNYDGDVSFMPIESRLKFLQLEAILKEVGFQKLVKLKSGEIVSMKVSNDTIKSYVTQQSLDFFQGNCSYACGNLQNFRDKLIIEVFLTNSFF